MSATQLKPEPVPEPARGAPPGVLDATTMSHLLDVELARARRYEHPFALLCVSAGRDAAVLRRAAGALRLHTRWADSVGLFDGGALLVILRDTAPPGARAAGAKLVAALAAELDPEQAATLGFTAATWRKGDDRDALLARLACG